MPSPSGPRSALVSWLQIRTLIEPGQFGIGFTRLARVDGSLSAGPTTSQALPDVPSDELHEAFSRLQNAERSQLPPLAWSGDLDGDGCPEILAPLIRAGCLGTGDAGLGPSWVSTRPLTVVGPAGDRRLLAAQGLEWYPFADGPGAPAPSAAGASGAWRQGPTGPFTLAELPVPTGAHEPATSVPAPIVDRYASTEGMIDLSGPPGARLLVRALGLPDLRQSPEPVSTRSDFLRAEPRLAEFSGLMSIPVANGSTPGSVTLDLKAVDPGGRAPISVDGGAATPMRGHCRTRSR
jgi:hypothetical protein